MACEERFYCLKDSLREGKKKVMGYWRTEKRKRENDAGLKKKAIFAVNTIHQGRS